MRKVKKLSVYMTLDSDLKVGELAEHKGKIYFEYDDSFIEMGLEISPLKLPLSQKFFEKISRQELFHLPGVFYDSLPDGWGLLLMDRVLRSKNINPNTLSPLDRLSYIGDRSIGAFRYHPEYNLFSELTSEPIDLSILARESEIILRGDTSHIIEELYAAGGSSGGARPKALIGLNVKSQEAIYGIDKLPHDYEHYIVKFRGHNEHPDIGKIEYVYSLMAKQSGIDMPDTQLMTCGKDSYFAVKRFDRHNNQKSHIHSLAGMVHSNFRQPELSYTDYLTVTGVLSENIQELEEAFRRMVFNVMSFNRDDHAKNFSFLMNYKGQWSLSPAYDLVFSSGLGGWHSMDIGGKYHPSIDQLLKIANSFGIKYTKAQEIIQTVYEGTQQFTELAKQYDIDNAMVAEITDMIDNLGIGKNIQMTNKNTPRIKL